MLGENSENAKRARPKVLTAAQKATRQEYRRNNMPAFRARQRLYRARNVEKCKELVRRSAYNLAEGQYARMLVEQKGVCAICEQPQLGRALAVDHNHGCCLGSKSCGRCVRGLLCSHCNQMLGHAKDSRKVLLSAVRYLDRYARS